MSAGMRGWFMTGARASPGEEAPRQRRRCHVIRAIEPSRGLPVREVVVVGVGVVGVAALCDEQRRGGDARSVAAVPAEGPLAGGFLERRDRRGDVLALRLAGELVVLEPAPAVAAHVEPGA